MFQLCRISNIINKDKMATCIYAEIPTGEQKSITIRLWEARLQNSRVIKRSVVVDGHKTSVSLEDLFWTGVREIAEREGKTMAAMLSEIEAGRTHGNLSSAIRLFVLADVKARSGAPAKSE